MENIILKTCEGRDGLDVNYTMKIRINGEKFEESITSNLLLMIS